MTDSFEVEIKVPVANHDTVIQALNRLRLKPDTVAHQEDYYYNHPCRDFSKTDEALRIRQMTVEQLDSPSRLTTRHIEVTYKGPKVDPLSKTRIEINTELQSLNEVATILEFLGFNIVGKVRKTRTIYHMDDIEICIDLVDDLGSFVELESLAMARDEVPTVRNSLLRVAKQLGLDITTMIRTSYLELILEKYNRAQE